MRKGKRAGVTLAAAAIALLFTTDVPQQLSSAVGGSAALAELASRSPGARIGGVALKAKTRRAALAPSTDATAPGAPGLGNAPAAALGSPAVPLGAVPSPGTVGPGAFPGELLAPGIGVVPGAVGGAPGSGGPAFDTIPGPVIGGLPIFVPGGGGGGGGGSGPPPGETPIGDTTPVPPVVPPGGPIPEPSTWLMMIAGLAVIGSAMRRSRRVRFA